MFSHPDPEALVVGAGPVGLVTALFLQQQGVRVGVDLIVSISEGFPQARA
jgi:glycine/D-amino acid oxidase-like deaminating enzyme